MRKLATRLGVTAPALYRHYESKESVLVDVVGEAFKVFAQYLYRAMDGRTPVERFRLTGRSYLAFALEHPEYYAILHASHETMGHDKLPHEATDHACAVGPVHGGSGSGRDGVWNAETGPTRDRGAHDLGARSRVGVDLLPRLVQN
jgi:AcrR family transcriptional regulator